MSNSNSIHHFIRMPDVVSLGNGVMGLLSIFSSFEREYELAVMFIVIAGFLDFLDGRLARRLGLASDFGVQLDSLCDICSFIIAPAVFAYSMEAVDLNIRIGVSLIYVIAGFLRLARFNITGTTLTANGKYFEGMPVPFSIAIICSYFAFVYLELPLILWVLLYIIHALLMISTVKIRKF